LRDGQNFSAEIRGGRAAQSAIRNHFASHGDSSGTGQNLPTPNESQTLGNWFDTRAGGKFRLTACLRTPPATIGPASAWAPGLLPDDIILDQDGDPRGSGRRVHDGPPSVAAAVPAATSM
jgi:hypothetical protein